MPSRHLIRTHRILQWLTVGLSVALVCTIAIGMKRDASQTSAYLVKVATKENWKSLTEAEVESGSTIPMDTHTVFHIPFSVESIDREVLFGNQGFYTRYWGYCFPQNYDPAVTKKRIGFPGLFFLSEKEREIRAREDELKKARFSIFDPPSQKDADTYNDRKPGAVRHQIDLFKAGMMCYVMSDIPLSIGLDPDEDGLNRKLELEIGTDPTNADSDGDGLYDGTERRSGITNPLVRDSDADGIIDGIEDANQNGILEAAETDPHTWDSDRDGLCDGMCRVRLDNGREVYAGEDKNLNGTKDGKETDPRLWSSTKDGISDEVPFLKCIINAQSNC